MTTMTAANTTASGRPRPPKIDKKGIAERESAKVAATLDSITDRDRRLTQAVRIIDKANEFLDDKVVMENAEPFTADGNETRMRKLALSLALLEGGLAVHNATSMSRYAFYKLTVSVLGDDWPRPETWTKDVAKRAKARGVLLRRDAIAELPDLATQVIEAHARRDTATRYRDQIIVELDAEDVSHSTIAALVGRERSRVTQIVSAHKAKAGDASA